MPMISGALTSSRPHQNNVNGHHPTAMSADHLAALSLPDATKCAISGNYSCRFCSKPFSSRSNMVVHERIHTRERPYSCSFCERAFSQHGQLVIHERSHTGHRPYKCQYCEKAFTSNKVLKIHVRTHTGEKPYACEHCGKRFAAYANLVVHRRIHTKVRPYKCPYCGRTFEHSGNLQRHIKIHTRNLVAGAVGVGQEKQGSGGMKTDVVLDKYEPDYRPQYAMLGSGEVPMHSSVTADNKLRCSQITKQSDASRHQQTSWLGNGLTQECPRLCQILGSPRPGLLGLGEMHGYLNSHQQQQLQYGQYCNLPLPSISANPSRFQHHQISASPEDLSIKGTTRIMMKMETELESEMLRSPRSSLTPEPSDLSVIGNWKQCQARLTPGDSSRSSPELNQGPDSTHKVLKQGSMKALSPKAAWMHSYLTAASETHRVPLSYDTDETHARSGQGVQPTDEPVEMQESCITSSVGTEYKHEATSMRHRETEHCSKPPMISEHTSLKPSLPLNLHQLHTTLAYVNPHHHISYSPFGLPHQTPCSPDEPNPAYSHQHQLIPPLPDYALQSECQDLSVKTTKHLPALIPISKLSNNLLR